MNPRSLTSVAMGLVVLAGCSPNVDEAAIQEAEYDETATQVFPVLDVEADQVKEVLVRAANEEARLRRQSDVWVPVGQTATAASTAMQLAGESMLPIQAYRSFDALEDMAVYGFDNPSAEFTIVTTSGERHEVVLGATSFSEAGFYARLARVPDEVFVVPKSVYVSLVSMLPSGVELAEPHLATYEQLTQGGLQEAITNVNVRNPWLAQVREHRGTDIGQHEDERP